MSVTLAPPKVQLKLQPVLKVIVYAALAGEFLRNTGITDDDQLNAVQQAVAEGLVERVVVTGRRPDGGVDNFTLTLKPPAPGEVLHLALEVGKSMLESVDVSLAASVKQAADLIKRRGLKPEYRVGWSARVRLNPALGADAIKRLNVRGEDLPKPPAPPAAMPVIDPFYTPPSPPPAPQRYAHTINTYTGPPAIPPTHVYKPVVVVQPSADPGISFTWETSVPRR